MYGTFQGFLVKKSENQKIQQNLSKKQNHNNKNKITNKFTLIVN